jgi:16S rRNA (guanine527-N7)-methyltransferase
MGEGHLAELTRLGIPERLRPGLVAYLDLVARWSGRLNLTGAASDRERVETLVRDGWRASPWVEGPELLDVGSGAGTPGLILALLRPELRVTLLEPRQKRWAFLREACRSVGREDVRVEAKRHDEWAGPPAGSVTLRALRLPLTELAHCCSPGGQLLVIGRAPVAVPPFVAEAGPEPPLHLFRHAGCST